MFYNNWSSVCILSIKDNRRRTKGNKWQTRQFAMNRNAGSSMLAGCRALFTTVSWKPKINTFKIVAWFVSCFLPDVMIGLKSEDRFLAILSGRIFCVQGVRNKERLVFKFRTSLLNPWTSKAMPILNLKVTKKKKKREESWMENI